MTKPRNGCGSDLENNILKYWKVKKIFRTPFCFPLETFKILVTLARKVVIMEQYSFASKTR